MCVAVGEKILLAIYCVYTMLDHDQDHVDFLVLVFKNISNVQLNRKKYCLVWLFISNTASQDARELLRI